jgi:hypothetical protein
VAGGGGFATGEASCRLRLRLLASPTAVSHVCRVLGLYYKMFSSSLDVPAMAARLSRAPSNACKAPLISCRGPLLSCQTTDFAAGLVTGSSHSGLV